MYTGDHNRRHVYLPLPPPPPSVTFGPCVVICEPNGTSNPCVTAPCPIVHHTSYDAYITVALHINLPCCRQQSLCSEMIEELCFAMRCHASHQRPALTRHCDRCMTPAAPGMARGAHDPPAINGSEQVGRARCPGNFVTLSVFVSRVFFMRATSKRLVCEAFGKINIFF